MTAWKKIAVALAAIACAWVMAPGHGPAHSAAVPRVALDAAANIQDVELVQSRRGQRRAGPMRRSPRGFQRAPRRRDMQRAPRMRQLQQRERRIQRQQQMRRSARPSRSRGIERAQRSRRPEQARRQQRRREGARQYQRGPAASGQFVPPSTAARNARRAVRGKLLGVSRNGDTYQVKIRDGSRVSVVTVDARTGRVLGY